jgi:hypothetical protein
MTFTEAAAEVLRLAGKPMHYKEITELAIEKNLLSHVGKSPEVTMGARLAALLKKEDKANPIIRVKPGVFGLREWDEKKGKRGKEKAEAAHEEPAEEEAADSASTDVNALALEEAAAAAAQEDEEDAEGGEEDEDGGRHVVSGDDALRADLAASGAELFDDEDDDDQPILAPPPAPGGQVQHGREGGMPGEPGEGGRRRRRRRRRGRGGQQGEYGGMAGGGGMVGGDRASSPRLENGPRVEMSGAGAIQPLPIIGVDGDSQIDVTRDPLAPAPRPMIRDRQQIMAGGSPTGIDVPLGEGEELAGKELADATSLVLTSFDRNAGPVPVRTVVEALMRRGRLSGDPAQASIQLSASLRADNMRRTANAQRPRFRFANGSRVALTDWALGGDLARLEQEVILSVERYRDAARRTMLRRIQELPGHAFVELALLALERSGMTGVKSVRRAGSPGGEAHFAAVHKAGGDEIRTAIIVRKDGREIGRERVTDLRGALHHYGPAAAGWLVTTGQVLSGAREEAATIGAAPVALYDGLSFCRLLEDNDVGVVRTRFPIAIPDLELLETLRG